MTTAAHDRVETRAESAWWYWAKRAGEVIAALFLWALVFYVIWWTAR